MPQQDRKQEKSTRTRGSSPLPANSSSPLGSLSSLWTRQRKRRLGADTGTQRRQRPLLFQVCCRRFFLPNMVCYPSLKQTLPVFTSPVLCAFLLARACLRSLRSLAHLSISFSPVLASTSRGKKQTRTYERVADHAGSNRQPPFLSAVCGRDEPPGCVRPSRSDFCRLAMRDLQLTS